MSEIARDGAPPPTDWRTLLDDRTATHVTFAQSYAREYHHGAPGHLDLMTIDALAKLLDRHDDPEGEP